MFPFSNEDLKPVVLNTLDKLRPVLIKDGGNIELVDIKAPKIMVRLQGACVGCSSSSVTLKKLIEKQLKIDIHPECEIVDVTKTAGCGCK
ncbi:MAG: NifU family protein [uncultured Campylobacterales bacterium]|uniref:NifU family protein n=1 Tax=uncultured Campylobacterales bacterium TaxID=352960 RepID=A0A6S6SQH6_9BACT|nr:MAG: NifU family protein [uncultured Campylobacterales bacterium]